MRQVKIEQLFQAAKAAPASAEQPMPEYLKTRVLAQLGETDAMLLSTMDLFPGLRLVFRWGLGIAVGVMLGCLAWSYNDLTDEPLSYIDVATIDTHMEVDRQL